MGGKPTFKTLLTDPRLLQEVGDLQTEIMCFKTEGME